MSIRVIGILLVMLCTHCQFTIKDNRIWDDHNGERVFHGLNVVEKNAPYIDVNYTEKDMKLFKEWGINGLRLGVMWPGVEPREGQFNETYLQKMRDLVELASKYNIHTLVEFHQDLFSQKFCADGVPLWAIPQSVSSSFPQPLSRRIKFDPVTGLPPQAACQKFAWGTYYTTYSVNKAFNHLWTNKGGLLDKFTRYWRKVAETFKNSSSVIAYELINEPWPGNMYTDPLIMIPGLSQITHMASAYDHLATQIRKVDNKHPICFQPVTWLNFINAGFKHPPGGFKYANKSILCYHYYKPPSIEPKSFMKARMRDIKRLKIAGILSEFYVENNQGLNNVEVMDLCQENSQSWFGWYYIPPKSNAVNNMFFPTNRYQQPNTVVVSIITRTYAQRIAGKLIKQSFNNKTKQYQLSYYHCKDCGDTTIYFSTKYQYTKGYVHQCYPRSMVNCVVEEDIYLKVNTNTNSTIQVLVTISSL